MNCAGANTGRRVSGIGLDLPLRCGRRSRHGFDESNSKFAVKLPSGRVATGVDSPILLIY